MNKKLKNIIKSFIFILIFCIGFLCITFLLYPKTHNQNKWRDFYALPNQTLDIVFIGSSHSFASFVPMVFNEHLNIDSYNLATNSATIEQEYFALKEAIKYHSPKVVVLEMFSIRPYSREEYSYPAVHGAFDTMRLSMNKINGVKYNVTDNKKLEFIIPIAVYHTRWRELELGVDVVNPFNNDFDPSPYYGYISSDKMKFDGDYSSFESPDLLTDKVSFLPDERMEILNDITKLCAENDIKLIYAATPYTTQDDFSYVEMHEYLSGLEDYANENDIDIIDFNLLKEDLVLDTLDFANNGHTNSSGAYLVSKYLAEYIENNYSSLLAFSSYDLIEESREKYNMFLSEVEKVQALK